MKNKWKVGIITVALMAVAVFAVAVGWIMLQRHEKNKYAVCVGECSDSELVQIWEERGNVYAIGVNSKGTPIFKDSKAAFEQALMDYSSALDYIQKVKNMKPLDSSEGRCKSYRQVALEISPSITVVENVEEVQKNIIYLGQFLGIYLNGFKE